ncbi:MAG: eL32 family ribosomal protein, partial [Candidatus Pacearchaeota archaeon]
REERRKTMKTEKRKKPDFKRTGWRRLSRLGARRKKKQKWRYPKGGDSKVRKNKKGYPKKPTIGWRNPKELRGKINGMSFKRVENLKQLEEIKKGEAIIIASVGKKKREEIIKKANEKGIIILNKYKKEKNESQEKA